MTREDEIATLMRNDATLMTLLPGGVYTDQQIGFAGLRRGDGLLTDAAFDAQGQLLGCAVVREGGLNPYPDTYMEKSRMVAVTQMVYIYFYESRGHDEIDLAKARAYEVLAGQRLTDSYPLIWEFESDHVPDVGPTQNATTVRQDWRVVSIRRPA